MKRLLILAAILAAIYAIAHALAVLDLTLDDWAAYQSLYNGDIC